MIFSIIVDRTYHFKKLLLITSLVSSLLFIISRICIVIFNPSHFPFYTGDSIVYLICFNILEGIIAVFYFGFVSIGINYICEVSYPNEEGVPCGIAEMLSRIVTFALNDLYPNEFSEIKWLFKDRPKSVFNERKIDETKFH